MTVQQFVILCIAGGIFITPHTAWAGNHQAPLRIFEVPRMHHFLAYPPAQAGPVPGRRV